MKMQTTRRPKMLKQWLRVKNKPLKLRESKRISKTKRVRLLENKLRSNSK